MPNRIEEPRPIPEGAAWDAVAARDRRYDGAFVYAVRTTGVYCRPSCPSRRPRRSNVEFYATPEAAERRGFRACLRCEPRSPAGTVAERRIRRAAEYIAAHLDERITLDALARRVGLSPYHLQRTFKRLVGVSPKAYHAAKRLERLRSRLKEGETVSRATYGAGFGSSRGVYERSGAGLGMTPGEYRRGGRGMEIRFATAGCEYGRLLVAATARGVCSVAIGDDDASLERELRREFPNAAIARADAALAPWLDAVLRHAAGSHPGLALPLDLHGTAFQLRVWHALREIPRGETRSYRDVAAAIGRPSAARAVARACAGNRAALVVPCHRVIREDGGLGGYRWGIDRKRRLLEAERAAAGRPGGGGGGK